MQRQSPVIKATVMALLCFSTAIWGDDMTDNDAIESTIFSYFDGFRTQNRELLEKAFVVDSGHMKGYLKDDDNNYQVSSRPMNEVIEDWLSRDTPPEMSGKIIKIDVYNEVAATALFDFNGIFIDAFHLAKIDGTWKIINKFYIDQ
jgi:hypothetical protein